MKNLSRRSVLAALGAGGALLPLIGQPDAAAQAVQPPRRLVVINWANGLWQPEYWPSDDFKFGQILSPLEPYKSDVLVVGGLDYLSFLDNAGLSAKPPSPAGGHDVFPAILTGTRFSQFDHFIEWSGGDSVDQYIADGLQAQGIRTPLASLQLGTRTDSGYGSCISYRGKSTGMTPEGDPNNLFDSLFAGRSLPKETFDKLRAERRSVLDLVGRNLEHFGQRLGTDDRAKIDAHLTAVRTIEKQFVGDAPAISCAAPTAPGQVDWRQMTNYPLLTQSMMDLLAVAMRCDLTRVATVQLGNMGGSGVVFSWLGEEYTGPGDEYPVREHHDIAHQKERSPAHTQRFIGVNKWLYSQVAYLVKLFKDTPEPKADGSMGSMLDNTAIVVTNMSGENHGIFGIPWTIIGSCGGYFSTGRLLKAGAWAGKTGQYWTGKGGIGHNGLLIGLANAMGVPTETFGDPKYGGELAGLRG